MSRIAYVRVSSQGQNTDRQDDAFSDLKIDKVFSEKVSGASLDRPILKTCLEYCREGDTLYVASIDRLARNLPDLLKITRGLVDKGVSVYFLKEHLQFQANGGNNPTTNLIFHILGAVASFERDLIKARQAEGIASAKRKGKRFGRPSLLTSEQRVEIINRAKAGENKASIAKAFNVSRATIYEVLKKD